jgi:predicted transcriptional regulator
MTTNTELIKRLRSFEQDHKPHGWPAIQMRDVTALLDTIEAQAKQIEALQTDAERYQNEAFRAQIIDAARAAQKGNV